MSWHVTPRQSSPATGVAAAAEIAAERNYLSAG